MKANLFGVLTIAVSASLPVCGAGPAFSAHEWGTFTSVQGADGEQSAWNPLVRTDLPSFVHDFQKLIASGCTDYEDFSKGAARSIVRMETPVIYFYAGKERKIDVRVDFPEGRITEWYPRASGLGPSANPAARKSFLEWRGVRILPPDTTEVTPGQLAREGEGSHYYAARETGANLLCMTAGKPSGAPEYERFLFYRGTGDFHSPLTVAVSGANAALRLSTENPEPLTALFALTIQGGKAKCLALPEVSGGKTQLADLESIPCSPLAEVRERLGADMQRALVKQGLYADEAVAMVNTWKDQWFSEQGTRILYLLPRAWTDRTLPLTIEPATTQIVRVMVGRSEVIMPAVEQQLHDQIVRYSSGNAAAMKGALSSVRHLALGRFLEPAVGRVIRANPDLAEAAWKLAEAAREPAAAKGRGIARQNGAKTQDRN